MKGEAPKTYESHVPVDKPESTAETEALPGLPEPFRDMVKLFPDSATPRSLRKKKENGGWIRLEIMVDPASRTTEYLIRQGIPEEEGKTRSSTFTYRVDERDSSMSSRVIVSTKQGSVIEGEPEVRNGFNNEDLSEMSNIVRTYKLITKNKSGSGEENG